VIIGLIMAIVSFFPVTLAYMYISIYICDRLGGGNMNTDDFMGAFICIIPILMLSLALALFGGDLGCQKNHKYLGAIIGGFLGPVIVLFLLTVGILYGWLN
jgi:hypothetical protein